MGQQINTPLKATYDIIQNHQYAGKYVYSSLATLNMNYGANVCTGLLVGNYYNIINTGNDGSTVDLAQACGYGSYDYSSDSNTYIWNVGVPGGSCSGNGNVPGTWMGTWTTNQYGPGANNIAGSYSVWVR